MAIGAICSFEGFTNGFFELGMAVRASESISMIVEGRSREVRDR